MDCQLFFANTLPRQRGAYFTQSERNGNVLDQTSYGLPQKGNHEDVICQKRKRSLPRTPKTWHSERLKSTKGRFGLKNSVSWEIALALWALWKHFVLYRDIDFIKTALQVAVAGGCAKTSSSTPAFSCFAKTSTTGTCFFWSRARKGSRLIMARV
jgi:hypothetical protein